MLQNVFFKKAVFTLSLLFLSVALNAQCSTTGWKKFTQTEQSSIALKEDGTIWMWGANTSGIKGDGTNGGVVEHPTQVGTASDWVDISAGRFFALALKANGDLYGWGSGDYGCLGLGNLTDQYTPVKIAENVKSFSAGFHHSMIVKTDGTMWGTGYNDWSGLGVGNSTGYHTTWQQEATHATNWAKTFAGYWNSFGIKTDGTLWSAGSDWEGQTGLGKTGATETDTFEQIGTDTNWKEVSCSRYHVLGLKTDGKLFGWGLATGGQLGIVGAGSTEFNTPQPIEAASTYTHIATSWDASAIIKSDGTLYAFGTNHGGILGSNEANTNNLAPQQVGSDSNWKNLALRVGGFHFGAVKNDTSIWAWGTDNLYQLGNGDGVTANSSVPTQVKCEDDGTMAVHDVVKDGVSVYPNPASDIVYVKSAQKPVGVVRIYSADGSLVKTIKPGNDGAVNISNLPAGVYILKTQNDAAGMKLLKK
ncbi:T9SS type A sorting domain-containing protein [Daejeonia sp. YH14]|uniref:RCC1 domain-containing protein n=1 Tax=Daejeonia sp. YH14 TaxID=3439042 RepID=UPI003F49AF93